jgi:hypothetical protein
MNIIEANGGDRRLVFSFVLELWRNVFGQIRKGGMP